jgi:hypothetical protein
MAERIEADPGQWREYRRRNLAVCSAIGAAAAVRCAQERLAGHRRPPKWLLAYLDSASERIAQVIPELSDWRAIAPDAPDYAKPATSMTIHAKP